MGKLSALFGPQLCQKAVYKITQATTAAPAIGTTLVDGIEAFASAPALARTSAGIYTITKTGAFTANKTFVKVMPVTPIAVGVAYTSADVITLTFTDVATPSAADSGNFDLEINIYP